MPVDWEGEDLIDQSEAVLRDESLQKSLTENALQLYMESFSKLDERVERMIGDLEG